MPCESIGAQTAAYLLSVISEFFQRHTPSACCRSQVLIRLFPHIILGQKSDDVRIARLPEHHMISRLEVLHSSQRDFPENRFQTRKVTIQDRQLVPFRKVGERRSSKIEVASFNYLVSFFLVMIR